MCVCIWVRKRLRGRLTTEVWLPPLVHGCSCTQAGVSVDLQLLTQSLLQALVTAHVKHTALEEGQWIHHLYAISGQTRGAKETQIMREIGQHTQAESLVSVCQ